ncbi:Amino acid transporter [Lasiodiplodia theobromae]|uniref:Amino acid transporter n=1 Tax=Lasiodiplodia theobromae TaxID=45133 RepID=UPI0015C3A4C9|nr:Amino acid transporter [Lasiodiplodia theobromae]KAF4545856.1 Amino acid transporter [Lasiodiplodia theobromae]
MMFLKQVVGIILSASLAAGSSCTTKAQRKAWHSLTTAERHAYIDAELCLMSSPPKSGLEGAKYRWDELHWVHVVQSNVIHGVGGFLPWHRYYVHLHEHLLRTECNYTGYQPYWYEVEDANNLTASIVWDVDTGFGGNGVGDDGCVVDGPFANHTLNISPATNNTPYCLSRDFNADIFTGANQTYLDECFAMTNYSVAWDCWATQPHGSAHAGIGGTMQDAILSPGDSIFFLHHANLDRLWWEWQSANLSSRLYDIAGQNIPTDEFLSVNNFTSPPASMTDYFGDDGNVTTLNHNLWMAGLIPNVTVGDVMDLGGEVICAEYI